MNILITNKQQSNAFEVSPKNLGLASFYLKVDIAKLKRFIKRLEPLQDATTMLGNAKTVTHHYAILKNGESVLYNIQELDWKSLMLAYIVSQDRKRLLDLFSFIDRKENDHFLLQSRIDKIDKEIREILDQELHFTWFDKEEMIKYGKQYFSKVNTFGDDVVFETGETSIGCEEYGTLNYKNIVLFMEGIKLKGFMLRFENFDYSSYWGNEVVLHPYLKVPYLFNSTLSWFTGDYEGVVKALRDTCSTLEAPEAGLQRMDKIIDTFNLCRKIWHGLREDVESTDRLLLSRSTFEKISQSQTKLEKRA